MESSRHTRKVRYFQRIISLTALKYKKHIIHDIFLSRYTSFQKIIYIGYSTLQLSTKCRVKSPKTKLCQEIRHYSPMVKKSIVECAAIGT